MAAQNVFVVTGVSRGIGKAFAQLYASQRNAFVIGSTRAPTTDPPATRGTAAGVLERVSDVDVGSETDVRRFAHAVNRLIANKNINSFTLINCAGVIDYDTLQGGFDVAKLEEQFRINAIGPLFITASLLPALRRAPKGKARVVNITSSLGSLGYDSYTKFSGCYGYRASKAALNSFTVNLAHDLKPEGIAVYAFHPGYVATELTRNKGPLTPEESVQGMSATLDKLTLEQTGTFWHQNGKPLAW